MMTHQTHGMAHQRRRGMLLGPPRSWLGILQWIARCPIHSLNSGRGSREAVGLLVSHRSTRTEEGAGGWYYELRAQRDQWSECGRAGSLSLPGVVGRPHRSLLSLG